MEIYLNGEPRQVQAAISVADLLESLGQGERRVAVEVNLDIVPRSSYPQTRLKAGDRVEIVQAIGGG